MNQEIVSSPADEISQSGRESETEILPRASGSIELPTGGSFARSSAKFKPSFSVNNESFGFTKTAKSKRKKPPYPTKTQLEASLASLVFSREESQVFELSRSNLETFEPLNPNNEDSERLSGKTESFDGNEDIIGEKHPTLRTIDLNSKLFVGDREIVLEDVLEEDQESTPVKELTEEEIALFFLQDKVKELQTSNQTHLTNLLDIKEENAVLRRRLSEMEEECAELKRHSDPQQLRTHQNSASTAEDEQLKIELERCQEEVMEQARRIALQQIEYQNAEAAVAKTTEELHKSSCTIANLKQKLQTATSALEEKEAELDSLKMRFQILGRRLVESGKIAQEQLRDTVARSEASQTEFVVDFYYKERCDKLEQQLRDRDAVIESQTAEYEKFKAASIQQMNELYPRLREHVDFVAKQQAFMEIMHAEIQDLHNYAGWAKEQERCFCFPSIQALARLFNAFSEKEKYFLWKLVDIENVRDFILDLASQADVWALPRSELLLKWDEELETKLRHDILGRYAKYYGLLDGEYALRQEALEQKWFLTDSSDHPLTLWIMWLLCFSVLGSSVEHLPGLVELSLTHEHIFRIITPEDIVV